MGVNRFGVWPGKLLFLVGNPISLSDRVVVHIAVGESGALTVCSFVATDSLSQLLFVTSFGIFDTLGTLTASFLDINFKIFLVARPRELRYLLHYAAAPKNYIN